MNKRHARPSATPASMCRGSGPPSPLQRGRNENEVPHAPHQSSRASASRPVTLKDPSPYVGAALSSPLAPRANRDRRALALATCHNHVSF